MVLMVPSKPLCKHYNSGLYQDTAAPAAPPLPEPVATRYYDVRKPWREREFIFFIQYYHIFIKQTGFTLLNTFHYCFPFLGIFFYNINRKYSFDKY